MWAGTPFMTTAPEAIIALFPTVTSGLMMHLPASHTLSLMVIGLVYSISVPSVESLPKVYCGQAARLNGDCLPSCTTLPIF